MPGESSQQPTRETATGGASRVVVEHGWASPPNKAVILGILGFLEVIFLSWAIAPNLPHRSAELKEFAKYQNAQTDENKEAWLKERKKTKMRWSLGDTWGAV
jgi:hypothetical protein